jgi:hypothetical protein
MTATFPILPSEDEELVNPEMCGKAGYAVPLVCCDVVNSVRR